MKQLTTRRPLTHTPTYRQDRHTGRAAAVWRDKAGVRRTRLLPGEFNSPGSRTAFERLRADVKASATGRPPKAPPLTVAGLLDAYEKYAKGHYKKNGRPTSTVWLVRTVGLALCERHAHRPAAAFGPLLLKETLRRWAANRMLRTECNRRLSAVKQVFKWAASEELVPAAVYQALATVPGLHRGRTPAREATPVRPVEDVVVDATLPFLTRHVRGLVEFQRLTGCRPGEACGVRLCDVDAAGPVWLYTPADHKTAHRGKARVIPVGPRAQEVLRGFLTADPAAHLFAPRWAIREVRAERSAARATPRYPSHLARNRRKRKPARERERAPGVVYTHTTYRLAVIRACDRAFPPPGRLARRSGESAREWRDRLTDADRDQVKAWRRAHRWHPNQLRHAFATKVRKEHGLEAAQVLLGHERADVTQVYAERNLTLATRVAAEIG